MKDQLEELLQLPEDKLSTLDPWAVDHITTSADDIEEVHTCLIYDDVSEKKNKSGISKCSN